MISNPTSQACGRAHIFFHCALILCGVLVGWIAPARAESEAEKPWLIFLLMGQSNMAGRGIIEEEDRVIHPRVFMLTREMAWTPALDPLHFDKPAIAGVGLGSTFGRAVAEKFPRATIGLVPTAFGGTSLDRWQPGGELYTNAVQRARTAIKRGRLAGILWHQGEADRAPATTATYATRFLETITQLRRDLDAPDVPVIIGELGRFRPEQSAINEVLACIPSQLSHSAFVSAEGLTDKGDRTHFDARSLRIFGHRYAEAWSTLAPSESYSTVQKFR